jgi:uncharacterized protein YfdQ (DUF2303 family)
VKTAITQSDWQASLEAGAAIGTPKVVPGFQPVVIVPAGFETRALSESPRHVRACPSFETLDSFVRYVDEFKVPSTKVFTHLSRTGKDGIGEIRAIIDYHTHTEPQLCQHQAVLPLGWSSAMNAWLLQAGQAMTQEGFANFLEDRLLDIFEPDAATLLEVAQSIEATTKSEFKSHRRLDNGSVALAYTEMVDGRAGARGDLEIPRLFKLRLAMFAIDALEPVELVVRLKYRIESGKLTLWFQLTQLEEIIAEEARQILDAISLATGILVYRGTPS